MKTKITKIRKDKKYDKLYIVFVEVNGYEFESIAVYKKDEIYKNFNITNLEFNELLK
jgi:hypothetical protein